MKIAVSDVVGPHCLTIEDGETVFAQITAGLGTGEDVELDFTGVNVFASPFFNAAIGQLLRDYPPETLNARLKVTHLAPNGDFVLRRVIENAKTYYGDPATRRAVDVAQKTPPGDA